MTFAERLRETRRLVLLRLLSEIPGYQSNSSILHAGLSFLGVASTRDDVHTDLQWLHDQGYVVVSVTPEHGVHLATLNQRGLDVANGRAIVPGVSRPSPK